jgi:GNAT superfamily N-acetyltransferase
MSLDVVPVSPANRADFHRVHHDDHDCGWCSCVAWWVPTWDGWGDRTAEENRALRESLFDRGEYDGYLLYADGEPIGWCQVGPRDRLEKLVAQFGLPADPAVWAITCFQIVPAHRGRGRAAALLDGVLLDLQRRGIAAVQAYPRSGERLDPEDAWTGPESLFTSRGFRVVRAHDSYPILQREL